MASTVDDIARAAGVSRTTVLRALSGVGRINSGTKERIRRIAAEMNYRPNWIARSLVHGRSEFIGVIASATMLNAHGQYFQLIEDVLRHAGYSVLFSTSRGKADLERICIESLIEKRVAGALIAPGSFNADPQSYRNLLSMGIKLVLFDRDIKDLNVPQYVYNPYQTARVATEYLISMGHQRIVHLAIPEDSRFGRERGRGFRDALAAAGIQVDASSTVETEFSEVSAFEIMTSILRREDIPTALVCRHDIVAIGALRAILAAGLSVPENISVIGVGDIWPGDMFRVPLTTVRLPIEPAFTQATRALLDLLDGKPVETGITHLDVELIIRSSCAPPTETRSYSHSL
ncbi:MAG: LacI family DNA-binding transcriptional regulator [Armatimonadetes bacterium]|nr:LacI family DNA-binding transcriptional regulator [Armatimonadota bacterium]